MTSKTSLRHDAASGAIKAGTTATLTRTFTADELTQFGALTRDYNPVHYEPRFCATKGFDAPICHGLLVGSMLCEPGGQWAWLASEMSFRFIKPVYVGDTITCTLTMTEVDNRRFARAEVTFTNQHGDTVQTGTIAGYLPAGDSRATLQTLLDEGDPTNPLT
jgi:3-hydroxybutyryl-CoA dehydratase